MEPNTTPSKALYRSRKQRIIAGVCGGFAEYFQIDVTLIRILWLLSLLFNGVGLIVYLLCALLMENNPEQLASEATIPEKQLTIPSSPANAAKGYSSIVLLLILLVIVIAIGAVMFRHWQVAFFPDYSLVPFLTHFGWIWDGDTSEDLLSLILIALGVIIVTDRLRRQATEGGETIRLWRSKNKRLLGGICGGLAEVWHIDATWLRLGFIVLALATNLMLAIIVYLILWIAMPEDKNQDSANL